MITATGQVGDFMTDVVGPLLAPVNAVRQEFGYDPLNAQKVVQSGINAAATQYKASTMKPPATVVPPKVMETTAPTGSDHLPQSLGGTSLIGAPSKMLPVGGVTRGFLGLGPMAWMGIAAGGAVIVFLATRD